MIFNMNGGGSNIELVSLTATANDTYTPSSGQAYNEVIVNVPTGIQVNGVEHTYRLAPNSTITKGDICCYGSIIYDSSVIFAVFPYGYDRHSGTSVVIPCVALETKTAGASGTVNIDVLAAE